MEPSLIRFRGFLLVLVAFFSVAMTPAQAQGTTPTEALALRNAALNRTAYTLPSGIHSITQTGQLQKRVGLPIETAVEVFVIRDRICA